MTDEMIVYRVLMPLTFVWSFRLTCYAFGG